MSNIITYCYFPTCTHRLRMPGMIEAGILTTLSNDKTTKAFLGVRMLFGDSVT